MVADSELFRRRIYEHIDRASVNANQPGSIPPARCAGHAAPPVPGLAERDAVIGELGALVRSRGTLMRQYAELAATAREEADALRRDRHELECQIRELVAALDERDQAIQQLRAEESASQTVLGDIARIRHNLVNVAAGIEHVRSLASDIRTDMRLTPASDQVLANVVEINKRIGNLSALTQARRVLLAHYAGEKDPNFADLLKLYDQALADNLAYCDIRVAVRVLAAVLQPTTYLEIGTRRGWSLAQVVDEVPNINAFVADLWVPDYAETEQGSPPYIEAKMAGIAGHRGRPSLTFIPGNSHDSLLQFFSGDTGRGAPQEFDIITVDGDHSRLGAWWDLLDVMPRVKVGGALVFDDLDYRGDEEVGSVATSVYDRPATPAPVRSLLDVWVALQARFPNFVYFTHMRLRTQAGIALRIR